MLASSSKLELRRGPAKPIVLALDVSLFLLLGLSAMAVFGQQSVQSTGPQPQPLNAADQERLRQLNQLNLGGRQISPAQRSELDRLNNWQQSAQATINLRAANAIPNQPPRPLTPNQTQRLQQLQQRGQLTPAEAAELQNLQTRFITSRYPTLSDQQRQQMVQLLGENPRLLSAQQQAEFQELQRLQQSGQLQADARNRLLQLQMQQDVSLRQNLSNEFNQLQQLQQSGRQISPLQQQRLQQLSAQQQQFTPFNQNATGSVSPAQSPLGRRQSPLGQTQSPPGTRQSALATPPGAAASAAAGGTPLHRSQPARPNPPQSLTRQRAGSAAGTQLGAGAGTATGAGAGTGAGTTGGAGAGTATGAGAQSAGAGGGSSSTVR